MCVCSNALFLYFISFCAMSELRSCSRKNDHVEATKWDTVFVSLQALKKAIFREHV